MLNFSGGGSVRSQHGGFTATHQIDLLAHETEYDSDMIHIFFIAYHLFITVRFVGGADGGIV